MKTNLEFEGIALLYVHFEAKQDPIKVTLKTFYNNAIAKAHRYIYNTKRIIKM